MAEINDLVKGYKDFYKVYFESDNALYKGLAKGQSPKTLVIACSDSRVDPAILLNAKPGDLFIARNVANLVPPYQIDDSQHGVSAIIEFAVNFIKVENIVILGHSNCAGINALLNSENMEGTDFIGKWMNIAMNAKEKALAKAESDDPQYLQHRCEREGIINSLENLMTFPWIKSKVEAGNLSLHGWYFVLSSGSLFEYKDETKNFEKIAK